jgi:hypothetical protein
VFIFNFNHRFTLIILCFCTGVLCVSCLQEITIPSLPSCDETTLCPQDLLCVQGVCARVIESTTTQDTFIPTNRRSQDQNPVVLHDFSSVDRSIQAIIPDMRKHDAATGIFDSSLSSDMSVPVDQRINCTVSNEVCDGLDNDCDSRIDEDLPLLSCGRDDCLHQVRACIEGVAQVCTPLLLSPQDLICNVMITECNQIVDGFDQCGQACRKVSGDQCYRVHSACLYDDENDPFSNNENCETADGKFNCGLICREMPDQYSSNIIGADCDCNLIKCEEADESSEADEAQFQCVNQLMYQSESIEALSRLSFMDFIGHYKRIPVDNLYHEVNIEIEDDVLYWTNAHRTRWQLFWRNEALLTNENCPYGEQRLTIQYLVDNGSIMITGIVFLNDLYVRQP